MMIFLGFLSGEVLEDVSVTVYTIQEIF